MRYLIGAILALVLAVPPAAAQTNTPLGFLLEPFNPRSYRTAPYQPAPPRAYPVQPYAGAPSQPYPAQPYPPQRNQAQPYQVPEQYQAGQQQTGQQYQTGQAYQAPRRYGAADPYRTRQAYGAQQGYANQPTAPPQRPRGLFSWLGTPLGAFSGEREPVAQATPAALQPAGNEEYLHRRIVASPYSYEPGTIVIDTGQRFLYLQMESGQALRYGVGVGRQGFEWNGTAVIGNKAEWPDWHPPAEMREREPWLPERMEGGIENPLGARALYLHEGGKDTLYRIHGTNQPETIGQALSSGCIRMLNEDVMDLYQRVPVGTKVVVV